MTEVVMRFPAERRRLADIRDFVAAQARAACASTADIDNLIQAVDELATNIIVHGYKDGPGEIEIACSTRPDAIIVTLRDRAPHFDATQAPEPNIHLPLEQRPAGGLGIYLARRCCDRFEHRSREGGGNELIVEIKLQGK